MSLGQLIRDSSCRIGEIGQYLDAMPHAARWAELSALDRDDQRALYEKAASAEPLGLEHFVPDPAPRVPIIHHGRNTLPLPRPFKMFQKRFCRPDNGTEGLYGYNEGVSRPMVGPGYFVAVATDGRPTWEARGSVVVDYYQVPTGAVAYGWPKVIPNHQGLQRFVYHRTRDFMRRVSEHASIGAAYKNERPLDHYFVLCRDG